MRVRMIRFHSYNNEVFLNSFVKCIDVLVNPPKIEMCSHICRCLTHYIFPQAGIGSPYVIPRGCCRYEGKHNND